MVSIAEARGRSCLTRVSCRCCPPHGAQMCPSPLQLPSAVLPFCDADADMVRFGSMKV